MFRSTMLSRISLPNSSGAHITTWIHLRRLYLLVYTLQDDLGKYLHHSLNAQWTAQMYFYIYSHIIICEDML